MSKIVKPTLTLKEFMLRREVLKLYRNFFRTIRTVPDESHRKELRDWIRSDFRTHKNHIDEYTIKLLLQTGQRALNELEVNLGLSGLKRAPPYQKE